MAEHNIQHQETQDGLHKVLAELYSRMEEVKARVSSLKTRQRAIELQRDELAELDASEVELRDVISAIDSERKTDWTQTLPDELLMNIIRYVPSKYMYWLGRVDRRWNNLMKQPPMLKLERSLRWTSNHLKQLKVDDYLPDTIVKKMLYDGDKLYVYVVKRIVHEGDNTREVETSQIDIISSEGTVTISDEGMTGEFTVHKEDVYYAVEDIDGQNKVKKYGSSNIASQIDYNHIRSMVVHGDHLFLATQGNRVCALDCLELKLVNTIESGFVLVKLISCHDQVLGLELGTSREIHTYEVREEKLIKGNHAFKAEGIIFSNGERGGIIDIACTKGGELCVYLESPLPIFHVGPGDIFSQVAYIKNDGTTLFSNEVRLINRGPHNRPCGMGVTGDYVYVNTISGDFCLVNLKTMRSVLYTLGENTKFSNVVLMKDNSLLGLLKDKQQIIRFHWDGS